MTGIGVSNINGYNTTITTTTNIHRSPKNTSTTIDNNSYNDMNTQIITTVDTDDDSIIHSDSDYYANTIPPATLIDNELK